MEGDFAAAPSHANEPNAASRDDVQDFDPVARAKKRIELDRQYIDQWSIWLDLRILLSTVGAVLFDRDAY